MRTRNIDAKYSWVTVLRVVILLVLSGALTLPSRGLKAAEGALISKEPRASAVPRRGDLLAQVFGYRPATGDNPSIQSQLVSTAAVAERCLEHIIAEDIQR